MVVRKGLGKNMDSVFSMKNVADVIDNPKVPEPKSSLPLSALKPGKFQPRNDVENSGLAELAQSIKQNGILNPIVVRKLSSDKYEILAGERRYQAAKIAGLKKVPVTILDVSDKQAMIVGLVENLQRKDLNALETAEGIQRLIEEFKYSHEGVAEAIGRSRPMISNLLRLLGLPEAVKTMLRAGEIEMGHARALLSLPEEQQVWLAQQIKEKGLSVRQTEEYVARYKERENTSENPHKTVQKSSEFTKFEDELSKILNTDVKLVSNSKGRGNLQISFKNEKEFAVILELLRSLNNK